MVETLLCLSITLLLSMMTMPMIIDKQGIISMETQFSRIRSLLEEAKTLALTQHQKVELIIDTNKIGYQGVKSRELLLDKDYYFEDIKEIYYNKNGNINQGNSILLCHQELCKSIVFNVGSGDFYLK